MEKDLPMVRSLMPEIPEVLFLIVVSTFGPFPQELCGLLLVLRRHNLLPLLEHRSWSQPGLLALGHARRHEGEHEGWRGGGEGTDQGHWLADVHWPGNRTGKLKRLLFPLPNTTHCTQVKVTNVFLPVCHAFSLHRNHLVTVSVAPRGDR